MNARILCVEDDPELRELMLAMVRGGGYEAEAVASAESALARASDAHFDVVVTDVLLPLISGVDLIPRVRQLQPHVAVIAVSGQATVNMAVTAMKRGAMDFLTKPFTGESLRGLLRVAVARRQRGPVVAGSDAPPMLGESAAMRQLVDQVDRIAPFTSSVLIVGETGTGKELVARRLHAHSLRASQPFVAINCAAVPEQLLEDELFGHVRGAFTGAHEAREGRFEQANGGTLFLDEIGDMGVPLQAKLLRVLQERQFERLGSTRPVHVDVRIVAATSADLNQRIAQGAFRPDLYYRLNVIRLDVPPLRARRSDVSLLAHALLTQFCVDAGLPPKQLSADTLATLVAYDWPGNVRQLRNAMERAAAMTGTDSVIEPNALPTELAAGDGGWVGSEPALSPPPAIPQPVPLDDVLRDIERKMLLDALDKTGGNKLQAARLLGIKRTTFAARLRRVQLPADE